MPDHKPTIRHSAARPDARRQEPSERLSSVSSAQRSDFLPEALRSMPTKELGRAIGRFRKARGIEPRKIVIAGGDELTGYTVETWEEFSRAWAYELEPIDGRP